MESNWNGIGTKTGAGGVGDVTVAEKNGNITNAVDAWLAMGLTQQQIAFGVATMGVESGFNPNAQATTTAYGLGQFTDSTWDRAVTHYNSTHGGTLDVATSRSDINAQIKVMGAWIGKIWNIAVVFKMIPA